MGGLLLGRPDENAKITLTESDQVENSKIQWTNHTMNPWRGCTKVSPGCKNCYADTLSARNPAVLGVWGPNGTRVVASEAKWREPLKWNSEAKRAYDEWNEARHDDRDRGGFPGAAPPERPRVFCASLSDVFEDWKGPLENSQGVQIWRRDDGSWTTSDYYRDTKSLTTDDVRWRLFRLIDDTPNLSWLILTKRPENIARMMPGRLVGLAADMSAKSLESGADWEEVPTVRSNLWLGTSVEDQQRADERIPPLLKIPAAVRFLSVEPLLGPIDLTRIIDRGDSIDCLRGETCARESGCLVSSEDSPGIDWVIVGGESGPNARPCQIEWIRDVVEQCKQAGIPCFVKKLGKIVMWRPSSGPCGNWPPDTRFDYDRGGESSNHRIVMNDKKGGDLAEWPFDFQVREFPDGRFVKGRN